MYAEQICKEALEDEEGGVTINGVKINNLRYADDSIIIARNEKELNSMVNKLNRISNNYGLKINSSKTKFMVVSKRNNSHVELKIGDVQVNCVEKIKYLGTQFNSKANSAEEIKVRIEQARTSFCKLKKVLFGSDLQLPVKKKRLIKCYVWSTLLCGVETWTLSKTIMKRLEAFEMWLYRRVLKIPWTERVSNVEILRRIRSKRELIDTINKKKTGIPGSYNAE